MKTYRILVHDRHCQGPITLAAEFAHDNRAREFAGERLASSSDYAAIEVWDGAERLCYLTAASPQQECRAA
jgi:hypothetical protein